MNKIIVDTYEELSEMTASILLTEMTKDKRSNLSITAGASPKGVYEKLAVWYKKYKNEFQNTYFYNFDEIEDGSGKPGVTISALYEQFYKPAGVEEKNIKKLSYANYDTYDQEIKDDGGIDVMMIGLGGDGHFCGNMPVGTDFTQETYKMYVKKEYPWYGLFEEMFPNGNIPEYFVTMGLKSLMKVKHLVLIVNGASKAEAVKKLFTLEPTNEFPATALLQHPNFTIILDKEAASLL
ncbi:6-phosphogluconolactonase/glucosamine-6-phosphate isomerase/deaminase [Breznakia sp. PF5-3]|uniref:glucosamine-6-phosphate deaminase n=1 Tax=unclassified Breznakia TaxID=2623764 RepID=UPI002405C231|nr:MULTISPECIES: glucosamine-6-phosphate deaminase [unclassified Breznakia]MDF9824833.1 6-phosphogluconolactonase/glucosamine-6-phosphate isomerase/deaminase [Breznakia sp. PM6-1]MDF9835205.1 6-phosphogluconolactonase/glucosamine-6-phosphate isomerase/deaminase [Breznakia sp. PF5-3]MDF9837317.1 6-phosphogluconolactonase/glucosamine-6-phosphate isomerase/deaminase [Breznakia sp. PFB2-8]MDF9859759.1 6-phosphogluconolactonase/glucosamine-6-phosphate isomerase/deaminase [Breznakia sp. PH5-24]